jgi:hypothetical protein
MLNDEVTKSRHMGSSETVTELRSSAGMTVNCKGCGRNRSWLNLEYYSIVS